MIRAIAFAVACVIVYALFATPAMNASLVAALIALAWASAGVGVLIGGVALLIKARRTPLPSERLKIAQTPPAEGCKHPGVPGGEHSSMWPGFRAPPADW